MHVRLLGGFAVEGIAPRDLGSRKARTLLALLASARGAPVGVAVIADALWGDDGQPARPADQVGVLVSRLRGVLGADRVLRTDGGYRLVADWLDVDEVAALAARASAARDEGRIGAVRAAAEAALALARGPLLPAEDGEWVLAPRAAAAAVVARVRSIAIDAAVAAGDHAGAVALAEAALVEDPYDEAALRSLMRAHLAAGRPASALRAYARVRARLTEDLGVPTTRETEAVYAVALAAADGDAPASAVAPAVSEPAFAGRTRELRALDGALAGAEAGDTPSVEIVGDAGMGKTSLVTHWAARARARGVTVLTGRCDELGRDLPLQPIADALADHLRLLPLHRRAGILGPDAQTLAPLLGPVSGTTATVVPDAGTGRAALFAALAGAIMRAGDRAPIVLVVEDVHLASHSTTAWLAFARHRCPGLLLVLTSREGDVARARDTITLRLAPLDVDAVADLVGRARAEALLARTGGHPLLLAALAPFDDGRDPLPRSVQEAVAHRIDALGEEAASTVRVAAVLGLVCDVHLLAALRRIGAADVLEHLDAAVRGGLLAERAGTLAFTHDLVRDAVVAAAGAARCAVVHRDAARVLASDPRADALSVAFHAENGGDPALAASSYIAAANAAAGRFDVDAAESYLARAVALDESAAVYTTRARVRLSANEMGAAAADAGRAVALGGGAAALEVAGWAAYYRRRYDDAQRYADDAVAQATDAAVRASALALAGRVRHGAGHLDEALQCLCAPMAGAPPAVRGVADVWLAQLRNHQGRPLDALGALAGPLLAPDALAHPWAPLHLRFNRAMALGQLGRLADARRAADELEEAVARSGQVGQRFLPAAANVRAWVLRWAGDGETADDENRRAFDAAGGDTGPRAEGMTEAYYVALLDLVDGCLLRADHRAAAALHERLDVLATWNGAMAWHQRHRLGVQRARVALAAGDPNRAGALARAVVEDAAARGAGRYELLATAVLGLADDSVPVEQLAPAVEGLGRCAVLDGWPLVAALATARGVDRWHRATDDMIGRLAASADDRRASVTRLAERVLARVRASPLG